MENKLNITKIENEKQSILLTEKSGEIDKWKNLYNNLEKKFNL